MVTFILIKQQAANTAYSQQQSILDELCRMENRKAKLNELDYPITAEGIKQMVKKQKGSIFGPD